LFSLEYLQELHVSLVIEIAIPDIIFNAFDCGKFTNFAKIIFSSEFPALYSISLEEIIYFCSFCSIISLFILLIKV
jgi:hypothetical protein